MSHVFDARGAKKGALFLVLAATLLAIGVIFEWLPRPEFYSATGISSTQLIVILYLTFLGNGILVGGLARFAERSNTSAFLLGIFGCLPVIALGVWIRRVTASGLTSADLVEIGCYALLFGILGVVRRD
jgi:hypothetical protein